MTDIEDVLKAGISVIPCNEDKRPAFEWAEYQQKRASQNALKEWGKGHRYWGLVCGKVSGGLCCIDVDSKYDPAGNLIEIYTDLIKNACPGLMEKLVVQKTQNKGYHFIYRCEKVGGNIKLAGRPTQAHEKKNDKDNYRVLIETRGEGGYFLCEPSPGYSVARGEIAKVQTITVEEQGILFAAAKSLNQIELKEKSYEGLTPLDDYNQRTSNDEVLRMLQEHEWSVVREKGGVYYLCRPGKSGEISATFNHIPNKLWVFSTSTQFNTEEAYRAAAVYTELYFNGDYSAAARDLAGKGFGTRPKAATGIVTMQDFEKELDQMYQTGFPEGAGTGIGDLDNYYKVYKGYLNIVTGIPTHGKSEFMDSIMVSLAKKHRWKWLVYSPESYPFQMHFMRIAQKYLEKPWKSITRMELETAKRWFDCHFAFIDGMTKENVDLDYILDSTAEYMKTEKLDGLLIDPWNELEVYRPADMSQVEFIGEALKKARKFARSQNLAEFIVAHPKKMYPDKNTNEYPIPTLYDIADAAHFYNKADNGLVVYRDANTNDTIISVQKIKIKYHGRKGEIRLRYDFETGNYYSLNAPQARRTMADIFQ